MKIEHHLVENMTLEEFADKHGLVMEVCERDWATGHYRFYARFKYCEVKEGPILNSVFGNGSTPGLAIAEYAAEIAGRCLVVNAYGADRRDLWCPVKWK